MNKRLAVIFIFISVMLDSMGIGLIMPVMPDLIQEVEGQGIGGAAVWGGILATIFAAMQFLFGPTLGSLSDRYGRRPILIISLVIMAFNYVLMALAFTIWLLIIARVIGGITAATQSTSAAYMADISAPEEKAANFGLIGAAFGVGFVLGPLMGGALAEFGTRAPFWAAAFLAMTNAVFGYYVLPESVTDRIRRPFEWRRANPLGAFRNIGGLPGVKRLLLISFVYTIAFFVYPGVWAYFGAERFGWGPGMIGLSLGIFGIGIAVVQGLLIRPILNRIGERKAVILGLSVDVLAFVALGFVTNGWVALALTPLTALGSIAGPALQGIMSRTAADNQQGELQGTVSSINAVATIVAPLMVTQTFWFFTDGHGPVYAPGAPFILSAILTIGCILVFVQTPRPKRPRGT
ncbi:DHA1 family tetracycline resistance protein-like MFS transporter [Loktanella sp. PT4BL]|jgi:DHA1 family tetracycline resistance protein-like MFS transporter|uniref:TCR/Tet family MFS transporter n=1 Tax=Loktanella sp. PT4BL TaxID=2135611 RepID=UPI000D75BCC1|nr:TCR/Tet family MFS transporter [Loktanella sp. PT4BL]PXW68966.1 DHA1 family tetracycline resistance protein-like MFS transporter [Loktanella sp. PT4BL]